MKFTISGEMNLHGETRRFTKEIEAKSESAARELVFALLGSQHGLSRAKIKIVEIKK